MVSGKKYWGCDYGDKAKSCPLTRTLPYPLKGCEEDCWDFEACLEKRDHAEVNLIEK
jgi:hypothetical protein